MNRWRLFGAYFFILMGVCFGEMSVQAGTVYNSPYVTFSPDRQAWTTDAGNQNVKWYAEGGADDVITGVDKTLRELSAGEHYYSRRRTGSIPVERWIVHLSQVRCCHNGYPEDNDYHGVPFTKKTCNKPHFSAWRPICADCGRTMAKINFYMSKETAKSLDYLEFGNRISYYYLCPFNNNLEQGASMGWHICNAVSYNRYCVMYDANANKGSYSGYMMPSFHMYNNADEYEGNKITPQTHLNPNTYTRTGWEFTGWNTKPDGSGDSYADEAEILNLCSEDYFAGGAAGSIRLYAMWRKSEGTLEIDPAGGQYRGKSGLVSVRGYYGEKYWLDKRVVKAPRGYRVFFDTMGGLELPDIRGSQHFAGWRKESPFMGQLQQDIYSFYVEDGNVDRVYATYQRDPITLPRAWRNNYSFGGWYYDKELTRYAGDAGTQLIPTQDMTLYAQWVELVLTSRDNYIENGGKGAVDLEWQQRDNRRKTYELFQSIDMEEWMQVFTQNVIGEKPTYEQYYEFSGEKSVCIIPYTGYYNISVHGAQGEDYEEHTGGLGGRISGSFWLEKGEKLTIHVGGQNGYNGGGDSELYGSGGGHSEVISDHRGLLLMAGGGGGAGSHTDGKTGGAISENGTNWGSKGYDWVMDEDKQSECAGTTGITGGGGGGGFLGGSEGAVEIHYHTDSCIHRHKGDPETGGLCYNIPVRCGRALEHVYAGTDKWYWGGSDEEYCPNCGTDNCTGHESDKYTHECPVHGVQARNYKESSPSSCSATAGYKLGCSRFGYDCGFPCDGYMARNDAAEGGESYVNRTEMRTYNAVAGANSGDGYVIIQLEDLETLEKTFMEGVNAGDRNAPDQVSPDTVERFPLGEESVKICWQKPEDNGTTYYHKVTSRRTDMYGEAEEICISNITSNTLISGVKGYLYCLDTCFDTEVNAQNSKYISVPECQIELTEEDQYLHLQALDLAGNVSESVHIAVGSKNRGAEDVKWPFYTEQLAVQAGENVYAASDKVYYVRIDGKTPFRLKYSACMQGPAHENYQFNYAIIESDGVNGRRVKNNVYVPSGPISDGILELPSASLRFEAGGESALQNAGYLVATRSHACRKLDIRQEFLLDESAHGKSVCLIPIAGVDDKGQTVYSDYYEDQKNRIWVIGDGEPPEIKGMEELADIPLLDRRERKLSLHVTAEDTDSGLKELYIEIENLDNGVIRQYYPDESGVVKVDICADEPVFSGDFIVTAHAKDNVGNESMESHGTTEFDLQAEIERLLEPKTPLFKRGESGCLRIRAWGYVDKIEVEFPEELDAGDGNLKCEYVYESSLSYIQEEENIFMIPINFSQNGEYTVTVRAYKGDKMLERHPALAVLGVEGTVLDELRTRLR